MNYFQSEAALQALVLDAIRSEEISEIIIDDAGIGDWAGGVPPNILPHFSIDRLCRNAAMTAGARVLKSLGFLEILSADKDVSMTAMEILRPDILCFNAELESVVIFELKKSSKPGRQAVSEFAAYEQEVKNHLPLISERDICFVLISAEWSTLMDHGVSAAITWSGKNILCLQASMELGRLVLRTRIPQAWQITGSVYLPDNALTTMTLSLYDKSEFSVAEDQDEKPKPDERISKLLTAVDVMAREGDRAGGHGFVILWRDYAEYSDASYNMTICSIAPFAIYDESRATRSESNVSTLVSALDRIGQEFSPSGHSESFFSIGRSAFPLLNEISLPTWEGCSTWSVDKVMLSLRAEPLICEFWGTLGQYVRDYVLNPTVRKFRPNLLRTGMGDWRDPDVAIPLITQFSKPLLFSSGLVRWSDSFQLGFYVGLDRVLRKNLRTIAEGKDRSPLKCRFIWNRADLMLAIDEMALLANSADNIDPPEAPLSFYADPMVDDEEDFNRFLDWVCQHFLASEFGHIEAFMCGLNGAPLFDANAMDLLVPDDVRKDILFGIEGTLRNATAFVLEGLYKQDKEMNMLPDALKSLNQLLAVLNDGERISQEELKKLPVDRLLAAWKFCLEASDWLVHGVLHSKPSLPNADIDWTWLRQGVLEAYARGDRDFGVILAANGMLGTGKLSLGGMVLPIKINDPNVEVLFQNQLSVCTSIKKMTWDQLMSMKNFPGMQ